MNNMIILNDDTDGGLSNTEGLYDYKVILESVTGVNIDLFYRTSSRYHASQLATKHVNSDSVHKHQEYQIIDIVKVNLPYVMIAV